MKILFATFLVRGTKRIRQRMADPPPDKILLLLSCQQSVMEIRVAWKLTFHLINEAEINLYKN